MFPTWNKKPLLQTMLAIYGFHSENNFWKKKEKKNLQFQTILLKCVTEKRTYINKGCDLVNPYLQTVLLSIPFNKIPLVPTARLLLMRSSTSIGKRRIVPFLWREESLMQPKFFVFTIFMCSNWVNKRPLTSFSLFLITPIRIIFLGLLLHKSWVEQVLILYASELY